MEHSITASTLREKYRAFFASKGHATIPSASLVPANDPTVLFTTAGMHPLVPHLLGAPHPAGRRLAGLQRCVRTGDIDEVGDDTHLTFFEMLGNWSLGDYFRDEAIRWSFEFLTGPQWLGLPLDRLAVTCFAGDAEVATDDASARIWRELGVSPERIAFLGRAHNWWGPAGPTGPCGPDTEMFFWVGDDAAPVRFDPADGRWVEIWNDVFMGYTKTETGALRPLARPNVDTGMGLERTLVALNGLRSVWEVDTVAPLLETFRAMAAADPPGREHKLRVLTDHLRAACFLIADGVGPSNKDQGYVLRRLLRRCILFARQLALPPGWERRGLVVLQEMMGQAHAELQREADRIGLTIAAEATRFERTLSRGLRVLARLGPAIDGKTAFDLFQTYGLPVELTRELALAEGKSIDEAGYAAELARHRELSRSVPAGAPPPQPGRPVSGPRFAGGLADRSADSVRYHTLTHLLQAALRQVLGEHVVQRGSNITPERLRFDFSHAGKLTPEQIARTEALVNGWIGRDLTVERATMPEAQARALGAIGAFGEKYGETVSVYTISDGQTGEVVSREFCGGPHVSSSRELPGRFRILREEAVSTGVRRIRARLRAEEEPGQGSAPSRHWGLFSK
jgi:alanyl-tRNA synthetase